jgi:hypothetical protein
MVDEQDIHDFAALVLDQQKQRLAKAYSQRQADAEEVQVVPGRVYTKVDLGSHGMFGGRYMVENATGVIYGTKAYGKVHKGHRYGTLETTAEWDWGNYYPERRDGAKVATGCAGKGCVHA